MSAEPQIGYTEHWWIPRVWTGMPLGAWLRVLHRHHWRVCATRLPMAALQTAIGVYNSAMAVLQRAVYGRAIANAMVDPPPIFIIGHWRSGTTLMHELLALDRRYTAPTSYQCFGAAHFLVTECFMVPWMQYLSPTRRPTDNMPYGLQHPQEDEFALCCAGRPSPYFKWLFPNDGTDGEDYIDVASLTPEAFERWRDALISFYRAVTYACPGRLVLKSPLHTARIRTLTQLFPGARFVHLVREPVEMLASTVRLWKRMWRDQALQRPTYSDLEEHVLEMFSRLYTAHDADVVHLPPNAHCTVRYEDLVQNPVDLLSRVYAVLELGDFGSVAPEVGRYWERARDHTRVPAPTTEAFRQQIIATCGEYARRFGYGLQ